MLQIRQVTAQGQAKVVEHSSGLQAQAAAQKLQEANMRLDSMEQQHASELALQQKEHIQVGFSPWCLFPRILVVVWPSAQGASTSVLGIPGGLVLIAVCTIY